jgi:hypothetical protein
VTTIVGHSKGILVCSPYMQVFLLPARKYLKKYLKDCILDIVADLFFFGQMLFFFFFNIFFWSMHQLF